MADADNIGDYARANLSPEDWEKIHKMRRLRELYHGRFTGREATSLLRHHNWDLIATNTFVLDALPGELRDVLGDEWQVVENARRNNVLRDLARLNKIGIEVRQYGCKLNDRMWWRRVPSRKPVSKCHTCKKKYEPIPRDKEWGIGQFECGCGHKFKDFAMMDLSILEMGYSGKSRSVCHTCWQGLCEPIRILPPMRGQDGRRGGRRSRIYTHCTASNCFKRRHPRGNEPIIFVCVHPNSLREKVHGHGSDPHRSTGSTVATFLSQGDIDEPYEPSLADIHEVHCAEDENELDVVLYQREPVGEV